MRYGLEAAAYPVQVAVNSPLAAWHWMTDSFSTREHAARRRTSNCTPRCSELQLAMLRQQALEQENAQLRELQRRTAAADQEVAGRRGHRRRFRNRCASA